jgi:two-component system chemotaxis response regulator CheY
MKSLIVEDDFATRRLMQIYLAEFGECSIAINGIEAVNATKLAFEQNEPYDLICLDIMMPVMDGMEALEKIREIEEENSDTGLEPTKVIITTSKNLPTDILEAFNAGCESYLVKPIRKNLLVKEMQELGLIQPKYQL